MTPCLASWHQLSTRPHGRAERCTMRFRSTLCPVLLVGAACLSGLATAQTYDFTSAFSVTNGNPNGDWSYGYRTSLAGSLNLYTSTVNVSTHQLWYTAGLSGDDALSVFKNVSGAVINGVQPGEAGLHSGPGGQYSVARFTAPVANVFTITGKFGAGDIGTVDVYVQKNGATIFSGSGVIDQSFNLTESISVGDTIEFVVGPAGGYEFDSTPLQATISSVPEPGTIAVIGVGAAALVRRRRRSQMSRSLNVA